MSEGSVHSVADTAEPTTVSDKAPLRLLRRTSEAEHFTELVAANRGARVRYYQDVASAL